MNVKVNIPYPEIRVEKENCYYADLLSQDYAGSKGEITAVMLYSFQHFDKFKTNPEISKILEEIAVVEMYHMELLAKTIKLLGKNPTYTTCDSLNYNCINWSADNVDYNTDLKSILKGNIEKEKNAIRNYKCHRALIKDRYIKKLIDRIIIDEQKHIEVFKMLYDNL